MAGAGDEDDTSLKYFLGGGGWMGGGLGVKVVGSGFRARGLGLEV